jgi:hypothetical protein
MLLIKFNGFETSLRILEFSLTADFPGFTFENAAPRTQAAGAGRPRWGLSGPAAIVARGLTKDGDGPDLDPTPRRPPRHCEPMVAGETSRPSPDKSGCEGTYAAANLDLADRAEARLLGVWRGACCDERSW